MDFRQELIERASKKCARIAFPEAGFSVRVREGVREVIRQGIADVILIGKPEDIGVIEVKRAKSKVIILDPLNYPRHEEVVEKILELRKHKGITRAEAEVLALDPIYFANVLCLLGEADGVVCGAEVATANTLRPALQLIKGKRGLVGSYFLFVGINRVTGPCFLMGDCAVNENPTAEEEALIAEMMLEEYNLLGLKKPNLAFLSYSTMGSADSESVRKVREAYEIFRKRNPHVACMGETQFDACVNSDVSKHKIPDMPFVRPANIFVMPNLDAGNIGYKLAQYFGGLEAIGPITMGLNMPVNDLSRGCSVGEIVWATVITVLQV